MRKSSLFTGILVAALSVSLLVFAGCDNPASGDSSGNTEQTGNNNQTGQNGGNNQNTNNGTVPNVTENVPESAEKVTTASQKEDFIYEVVNKSNKKVSVAVFISDNQKYGENPNNRDAAIVAITDAVELAAGESHEFKFSINDVTAKYGTGTCFGFAFVPEGGSRSRGWMNGTVYGKGRKHTVTINEYFNARNSWSYLPGNPAINVHGYWEGIYQGKDAFIRLRADGDMSLIVYNKDSSGKITGWSESDGTWTCDSEKIFASYYDVDKKAKVNAEIPYQTAADSIKFTIDGAQSTWTASTTFEVDEWKDSQDEKWSELASKDENGKYIYYCYGYNKLPKEYWDYEDSDVFYRTGETSIANMYYESCASKIEEALNKKEFDVSDFDGGCLILKSNPQTGSGSNQNTNQGPVTSERLLLEAVDNGIKVTVIGKENWGSNTWLEDITSNIDIFIKKFDSDYKYTFIYPFTEQGKNYQFRLHDSSSGNQPYNGETYTITAKGGSGYPMSDKFTDMTLALSHNDAGVFFVKFNTTATKFGDLFKVDLDLLTNGKKGSPSLGTAIYFGYPGVHGMCSYSNLWMYFNSADADCVSGSYSIKDNKNEKVDNLFSTMQQKTFETNVMRTGEKISDYGNVYCARPNISVWTQDAEIYYSIHGKYSQRYDY